MLEKEDATPELVDSKPKGKAKEPVASKDIFDMEIEGLDAATKAVIPSSNIVVYLRVGMREFALPHVAREIKARV